VKLRLEIQRSTGIETRKVRPHTSECVYPTAEGTCPGCGVSPFWLCGNYARPNPNRPYDELRSGGKCVKCGDSVGWVYTRVDTIFGIEEDRRVLAGRWKVY
jgi:hypothetical protein